MSDSLRILVDATSLLLRSAGVKSYTWHWLNALREAAPDAVSAFPFLHDLDRRLDHEHSLWSGPATWPRLAALFLVNSVGHGPMDAICGRFDVFHASNMVRVAPRTARLTATLHDLTCWLMPELHTAGNIRADRSFAKSILCQADGLIAVSENTRRDAIQVLGIPPERITVIHSGIDERFFTARPLARERPYVLFLGTIEPRKNLDTLLDAWRALPRSLREEYDLLVAGPSGWNSAGTLARLAEAGENVRYLGYVAESDIPALTAGATAFAYISLYEGFGFPVAQALAAGVPVVTSNTSSLPEIAGDGALLVDPRSPAEIASSLERLLSNPDLRATLAAAGRDRARRYRWEECARRSLEFFKHVAGR